MEPISNFNALLMSQVLLTLRQKLDLFKGLQFSKTRKLTLLHFDLKKKSSNDDGGFEDEECIDDIDFNGDDDDNSDGMDGSGDYDDDNGYN